MGIKSNFNKLLKETCPEIFTPVHLSHFAFKKVAIDISLYMNKYKAIDSEKWLIMFINLVASLRRNEIHCVFVFDGKSPPEKRGEQDKRKQDREKYEENIVELEEALDNYHKTGEIEDCIQQLYKRRRSPKRLLSKNVGIDMEWVENKINGKRNQMYKITKQDYIDVMSLFDILNIPYVTAPGEAEKMCAGLCVFGLTDAALSEDTDVMAYGAHIFLSKIETGKDICVQIDHKAILDGLDMTSEQFLDLCIMCGTDYNDNIPKVGSKTAYKLMQEHGSIEQIATNTCHDTSILNHSRVRELFAHDFSEYKSIEIPYCGKPNFNALLDFCDKKGIKNSLPIKKLRTCFEENTMIFIDDE